MSSSIYDRPQIGKILQNKNGQYFYVCGTCHFEFITLDTFIRHRVQEHYAKEPPSLSNDFIDTVSNRQKNGVHENQESTSAAPATVTSSTASNPVTVDLTEPEDKMKMLIRRLTRFEPRHTQLVSPKLNCVENKNGIYRDRAKAAAIIRNSSRRMKNPPKVQMPKVVKTNSDSGTIQCSNCNENFTSLVNLDSHEVICSLVPLRARCNYCNKMFAKDGALQDHIRADHPAKFDHVCELCQQAFIRSYELEQHRRLHLTPS